MDQRIVTSQGYFLSHAAADVMRWWFYSSNVRFIREPVVEGSVAKVLVVHTERVFAELWQCTWPRVSFSTAITVFIKLCDC